MLFINKWTSIHFQGFIYLQYNHIQERYCDLSLAAFIVCTLAEGFTGTPFHCRYTVEPLSNGHKWFVPFIEVPIT